MSKEDIYRELDVYQARHLLADYNTRYEYQLEQRIRYLQEQLALIECERCTA